MVEERGWYAQPWDGRNGVGKHLTTLLGGEAHRLRDRAGWEQPPSPGLLHSKGG
jgi:hypothetical protein